MNRDRNPMTDEDRILLEHRVEARVERKAARRSRPICQAQTAK